MVNLKMIKKIFKKANIKRKAIVTLVKFNYLTIKVFVKKYIIIVQLVDHRLTY